jgi:hypothetical protein
VGMQISAVIMENRFLKIKNRTKIWQQYSQYLRNGNDIECPSTDEWIKKMWYMYKMEYYSVIEE